VLEPVAPADRVRYPVQPEGAANVPTLTQLGVKAMAITKSPVTGVYEVTGTVYVEPMPVVAPPGVAEPAAVAEETPVNSAQFTSDEWTEAVKCMVIVSLAPPVVIVVDS
jgi:hypothetical protein